MTRRRRSNRSKRKNGWKKWIIISLTIFGLLLAGTAAYGLYLTNTAKNFVDGAQQELETRQHEGKSKMRSTKVDPSIDNISILFLGVDDSSTRNFGSATRTDAMILATFNEEEKSIKMVSIPRDSRVELAGRNTMDKITHAHAFGGIDMAVNTVENLFEIPVDYFVRVNFEAFVEIINALDGVEVDVPFEIYEQNSEDEKNAIHINEGLQTLNGEEALAFVRTRKYDSDIARGHRQQQLLKALLQKTVSIQSVTKYDDVLKGIGENLTTNMSFDEMTAFHDYAYQGSKLDVEMLSMEGQASRIDHLYYYLLNDESVENISTEFKQHLELEVIE
ncbi:LCP family protein [Bacillus tianshenii]|nr:LCP family protein [Bacillus tianshenii]